MLRRRQYFQGRSIRGGGVKDVAWLAPDGREMDDEAWNADFVRSIGMLLSGNAIEEVDERGEPITGDTLLVLLNAHTDKVPFTLPPLEADQQWQRVVDTIDAHAADARLPARRPLSAAGPLGRGVPARRRRCANAAASRRARKVRLKRRLRPPRSRNRSPSARRADAEASRVGQSAVVSRQSTVESRESTDDYRPPTTDYRLRHGRVIIDEVRPAIDGGRFPIKRTLGERVDVTADRLRRRPRRRGGGTARSLGQCRPLGLLRRIRRDLEADLKVRTTPETQGWRETPLTLTNPGTDEWTGAVRRRRCRLA